MLELLPEDILIIILRKLDFKSQANLYEVSERIQSIFLGYKVTKECNISSCTLATVKTLQTQFFKIIAPNLLKLDLCAVQDLSKTSLLPLMTKLKHLETLDVSYTKINLKDFIDIYKVCPTIKNITIQYNFGPKCSAIVPMDTILECQKIFKHFDSIHFYGSYCNLMQLRTVPFMLQLSTLKNLQYTIMVVVGGVTYTNQDFGKIQLNCNHFHIIHPHGSNNWDESFPFNVIEAEAYEYLIIHSKLEHWDVFGSPIFNEFFKEKFESRVNNSFGSHETNFEECYGSTCIMLWNKNSYKFDKAFFTALHKTMKQFLVCFASDRWPSNTMSYYDKFCITPREREGSIEHSNVEFGFKRKRIVSQNHILDYDEDFRDKTEVQLYLMFPSTYNTLKTAITLNSNSEYLKKLTYLNLSGAEKTSATFFNILFRSCVKLVTLNVGLDNLNAKDVARSAPLSSSIKNLRIVTRCIDFNSVLTSLSQCSTLENVHIVDLSTIPSSTLFDPSTMIQKCVNLYCLHIYNCGLSVTKRAKQLRIIENIKYKFQKPHLSFLVARYLNNFYESMPYVEVFMLSQIKDIKLF